MKRLKNIGNIGPGKVKHEASQVISPNGLSMTICACTHGYAFGYVMISKTEKSGQDDK